MLPPNVYCMPERTRLTLDLARFKQVSAEVEQFFVFAKELNEASYYTRDRTVWECFKKYFEDKSEAYKLLRKMQRDAEHRRRRDELYERLDREEVLKCNREFIVYCLNANYYVTEDGSVYELKYRKSSKEKEAIFRLYEKGKTPKSLVEVKDPTELSIVAKAVGKVCPELVPVIAP